MSKLHIHSSLNSPAKTEPVTGKLKINFPQKNTKKQVTDPINSNLLITMTDKLDFDKLQYLSEWWWSNGGKRYKHIETGKEYFVKHYKNPDQSKSEFIANIIYQELWLWAAKSYILNTKEWICLVTEKINWKTDISNKAWIKDWFIVDCWLANRDAVKYGNMLQGENDLVYRIDNGWSLFFRAQGKNKTDFNNTQVNEIISLRKRGFEIWALKKQWLIDKDFVIPRNIFAPNVFWSITDDEVIIQLKKLKEKMTDAKIKNIVDMSGISDKDTILNVLIKRRDYLLEMLPLLEKRKYHQIIEKKRFPILDDVIYLLKLKEKIAHDSYGSKDIFQKTNLWFKNRKIKKPIHPWILTHGISFDKHTFENILNNWLLCWEYFLRTTGEWDITPYNADFFEFNESNDLEELYKEHVPNPRIKWFGTRSFLPSKIWKMITLIFDIKQLPKWYTISKPDNVKSKYLHKFRQNNHTAIEWWLPSTTITSIIRDDKVKLEDIVEVLKKTWVYIPIFDIDWNKEY